MTNKFDTKQAKALASQYNMGASKKDEKEPTLQDKLKKKLKK